MHTSWELTQAILSLVGGHVPVIEQTGAVVCRALLGLEDNPVVGGSMTARMAKRPRSLRGKTTSASVAPLEEDPDEQKQSSLDGGTVRQTADHHAPWAFLLHDCV